MCNNAILGFHVVFSFLKYLAKRQASSFMRVSIVWLLPCLILGILTLVSNSWFSFSVSSLVFFFFRTCRFPRRFVEYHSVLTVKSFGSLSSDFQLGLGLKFN